jgi:uncharacterized circularly permuted ATP-grasp superfamily protein/uncharacterized alpha-E superfamily protein
VTGQAAPAWHRFFATLGEAGLQGLEQRRQTLAQQVRANGITYNVYADASGPQRPWSVDLFPLLIDPDSWARIEAGVLQRIQLLESVMADIYGPQRLVAGNLLPPALVHGHPGYLRGMHGVTPAGGRFLHIVAFDLARDAQGLWWVVSQRAQAPSGLGYLLENRSLVSGLFSEACAQLNVRSLAESYRALVEGLRLRAPVREGRAHIALLTPGPYNETYFEHAYLARYLGLTLVEGADLTVRDERLYLKTVHGLEPVQVLLKRLDDEFLDPLELRADSRLGVPGLMQAVRAGHVLVANAPGSALLESPALLGFLPALSEYLLGETLSLPSLATWWCGERAALDAALPDLGQRVIKPTYGAPGATTVLGRSLDAQALHEWAERMQREPEDYTVQDYLPLSQMPTWDGREMVPRSLLLRVFAMSDDQGGWQVLPGGLTRLAGTSQEIASMQRGGSSADTWVLGLGAASPQEPGNRQAGGATQAQVLTSRSAENLFWLGRYAQRAEQSLQLAQQALALTLPQAGATAPVLDWVDALCRAQGLVAAESPKATQSPSEFHLHLRIGLQDRPGHTTSSVAFNLEALRLAASAVRERLGHAPWSRVQELAQTYHVRCAGLHTPAGAADAVPLLAQAAGQLARLNLAPPQGPVHDDGARLLVLGRWVERLGFIASALLRAWDTGALRTPAGSRALGQLLLDERTASATPADAVWPLLVDAEGPRSLAGVTAGLQSQLEALGPAVADLARAVSGVRSELSAGHTGSSSGSSSGSSYGSRTGPDPSSGAAPLPELRALVERCANLAWQLPEDLGTRLFNHSDDAPRSVGA